jgi:alpha-galactosidase
VPKKIELDWIASNVTDNLSGRSTSFDKSIYRLKDLWTKKDLGTTKKVFKGEVGAHDVLLLRLIKE